MKVMSESIEAATSQLGALNGTHARQTTIRVPPHTIARVNTEFSTMSAKGEPATDARQPARNKCSAQSTDPWIRPQSAKFQDAPCQIPASVIAMSRAKQVRARP